MTNVKKEVEMNKSMLDFIGESVSRFYTRMGIVNEEPHDAAIALLALPTKEAKEILESIVPHHSEMICSSLASLSEKIEALLKNEAKTG